MKNIDKKLLKVAVEFLGDQMQSINKTYKTLSPEQKREFIEVCKTLVPNEYEPEVKQALIEYFALLQNHE